MATPATVFHRSRLVRPVSLSVTTVTASSREAGAPWGVSSPSPTRSFPSGTESPQLVKVCSRLVQSALFFPKNVANNFQTNFPKKNPPKEFQNKIFTTKFSQQNFHNKIFATKIFHNKIFTTKIFTTKIFTTKIFTTIFSPKNVDKKIFTKISTTKFSQENFHN